MLPSAARARHHRHMFGWLQRLGSAPPEVRDDLWAIARQRVRLLDGLDDPARQRLRARTARFLATRNLVGAQGLELDDTQRVIIAAQAALPLLNLPFEWLGHWHDVVVYPGEFRVRRTHHDSDTDVVTEWDDELAGEAWESGPIILSWADIERDLAEPFAGFNVVIHEIAHKIDMASGASDGMPPLRDREARRRWREVMQEAFDRLNRMLDEGFETPIDPYAAEAPDEFFATVSEYWFSAPDLLEAALPQVHVEFSRFYRGEA
jgi:Mlc titration factor MtfA (ptsG expression regulator)